MTTPDRDFDLVCTACKRPGADYLEIDDARAMKNLHDEEIEHQRRIDKSRTEGLSAFIITGAELLNSPAPVPWQAWHRKCDPCPQGDHYWIAADRITRWQDVAEWTAHLMGKRWFQETDWNQLLYGLSNNNGRILRLASQDKTPT